MKKQVYVEPELKLVLLAKEDVVRTSDNGTGGGGFDPAAPEGPGAM